MNPDTKPPPHPKAPRHGDDSFTDLERLDRSELDDEEADWENETGVRRVQKTKAPLPTKLAGCA
jgi:hypothetical protein